jgi:hypothetical protein
VGRREAMRIWSRPWLVGVSFIGFCASIVALVDFLLGHGADRGVAGIALVIVFFCGLLSRSGGRRPHPPGQ